MWYEYDAKVRTYNWQSGDERRLALLREAMPMIDELGRMRMDIHSAGNPLECEDWLERAKAEVG